MGQLKPCGTQAAYTRHIRNGEEPCDRCRLAHNAYMREQYALGARPVAPLKPCGTYAAYQRHIRRGEEPCDPCREANRLRSREYAPNKAAGRARQRALWRLRQIYADTYDALFEEEKAKEGLS